METEQRQGSRIDYDTRVIRLSDTKEGDHWIHKRYR